MTLEELGRVYLSQVPAIEEQIRKTKENIKNHNYTSHAVEYAKLVTLREIRHELLDTGWRLVNFYKEEE